MAKRKYNAEREMELARGYRELTLGTPSGRLTNFATKEEQDMAAFLGIFHPELSEDTKRKVLDAMIKE